MDKSIATTAIKVTDWDAYTAERHAEKLRQTRARLNDRVAVLTEFGADGLRMADEIIRLRRDLEHWKQAALTMGQEGI